MKKSIYVPLMIGAVLLIMWSFVPAKPFCHLLGVSDVDCTAWASGLFGVSLGGVITLWASWYFGDKSSDAITAQVVGEINAKLKEASDAITAQVVGKIDAKLKEASDDITLQVVEKIDAKLKDASKDLIGHMDDQLRETAKRLAAVPGNTVTAIETQALMTALLAAGPLIAKAVPPLVKLFQNADDPQKPGQKLNEPLPPPKGPG